MRRNVLASLGVWVVGLSCAAGGCNSQLSLSFESISEVELHGQAIDQMTFLAERSEVAHTTEDAIVFRRLADLSVIRKIPLASRASLFAVVGSHCVAVTSAGGPSARLFNAEDVKALDVLKLAPSTVRVLALGGVAGGYMIETETDEHLITMFVAVQSARFKEPQELLRIPKGMSIPAIGFSSRRDTAVLTDHLYILRPDGTKLEADPPPLGGPARSISWSDDGRYLAVSSMAGDISIVSTATGKLVFRNASPLATMGGVKFCTKEDVLCAWSRTDPQVRFFRWDGTELKLLPTTISAESSALAISADGSLLAYVSKGTLFVKRLRFTK